VDGERQLVSDNSFVWTPSTVNANYRVEVWLRSAGSGDRFKSAEADVRAEAGDARIRPAILLVDGGVGSLVGDAGGRLRSICTEEQRFGRARALAVAAMFGACLAIMWGGSSSPFLYFHF